MEFLSNDKLLIVGASGIHYHGIQGTPEEQQEPGQSYRHLCGLRDEVIAMGVLPPISEWHSLNPNIK